MQYADVTRSMLANRSPRSLDRNGWMEAAVLLLLYPRDGRECILFTVRTDKVEHHKGQISFPGGAVHEADLDLEATALRETYEEVGIDSEAVEVLGRLDDMVTISNFRVTPIVGAMTHPPDAIVPSPLEVAEVLEVPVEHLLDAANLDDDTRERNGALIVGSAYIFGAHRIWGATARMLTGYLELLRAAEVASAQREAGV